MHVGSTVPARHKRDPRISATFIGSNVGPGGTKTGEHIERFPNNRDDAFQYDLVISVTWRVFREEELCWKNWCDRCVTRCFVDRCVLPFLMARQLSDAASDLNLMQDGKKCPVGLSGTDARGTQQSGDDAGERVRVE